ncbi:hypothetical protein [Flavobacterium restrictum]|uniref:DUF4136 domain-containing protein n=1 Tax=Flavobacterium restrictum TaxID=2594428 RepID=A0A553ED59_9FLAO|nr:hypothetical protein [Flavobacterium restrictum]TRX42969.1 hypothetical protein FNW21_01145 [Flavobacterium restrictum]
MKKFLVIVSCIFMASCGSNTAIVNSWRDPDTTIANQEFKKVLVVALVKDEATRRTTENRIASSNPIFHSSYSFLNGTNLDLTKEQKIKILNDENFDGVVTMRLVSTEKETSYVPGTNTSLYYGGMGGMYSGMYGYGFGNWYGMYSSNFYNSGYYQETTYYLVETNIFSLKENKLIWTGTTKSSNITDIGTTVDAIMQAVVGEMKKDGSLPKK